MMRVVAFVVVGLVARVDLCNIHLPKWSLYIVYKMKLNWSGLKFNLKNTYTNAN